MSENISGVEAILSGLNPEISLLIVMVSSMFFLNYLYIYLKDRRVSKLKIAGIFATLALAYFILIPNRVFIYILIFSPIFIYLMNDLKSSIASVINSGIVAVLILIPDVIYNFTYYNTCSSDKAYELKDVRKLTNKEKDAYTEFRLLNYYDEKIDKFKKPDDVRYFGQLWAYPKTDKNGKVIEARNDIKATGVKVADVYSNYVVNGFGSYSKWTGIQMTRDYCINIKNKEEYAQKILDNLN